MSKSKIILDSKELFDTGEHNLIAMSMNRESQQRNFAGLDGVFSIDLGKRERKIKQQGFLTAVSVKALLEKIELINSYIDGQIYTLVGPHGISYPNVRMDSFILKNQIAAANQARCDYEIVYTQLSS